LEEGEEWKVAQRFVYSMKIFGEESGELAILMTVDCDRPEGQSKSC